VLGKREKHSFITNTGHKANYQERYFIDNDKYSISKPYIVKHSKNIIDLIEVKDIIKVYNLCGDNITFCFEIYDEKTMMDLKLGLEDKELEIKSIVTKEQFASMEYKVKE